MKEGRSERSELLLCSFDYLSESEYRARRNDRGEGLSIDRGDDHRETFVASDRIDRAENHVDHFLIGFLGHLRQPRTAEGAIHLGRRLDHVVDREGEGLRITLWRHLNAQT